ncbi:MAG TPA: hypothetical protein VEC16_05010 [Alphaproteobacteria bacterium]|nr:hypothetical protein [Alphaproteobacteria bacterium]
MVNGKYVDLVVSGPDFSGTSTQIDHDIIPYLKNDKNLVVRDIRGTEFDALFHAEKFKDWNKDFSSLEEFRNKVHNSHYEKLAVEMTKMLAGIGYNKLHIGSMVDSKIDCDKETGKRITEYIDPNSADAWIMEEPTYRGAGQVVRTIELYRTKFGSNANPYAAAMALQAIREDEFLRFRGPLRDAGKIIVRSRSEEAGCYQIHDKDANPNGIKHADFYGFPGNQKAFENPPTDLFIVCGPKGWDKDEYIKLKEARTGKRITDDFENNIPLQLLINERYAGNFIEDLYKWGCGANDSKPPKIYRFDIYKTKEVIRKKMQSRLEKILDKRESK